MARRVVADTFIETVELSLDRVPDPGKYPFALAAVKALAARPLALDPKVTVLVGENGSGKSTLLEGLAVAAGFNAEGGTKNFDFETRRSHSELHEHLALTWGRRPRSGFFFRGESFFNVATEVEKLGVGQAYGDRSLHEQSHGEAFLSLVNHRFGPDGLYLLDEPEQALAPQRQLSLLAAMHALVLRRSQFVMATHSPILMAYPGATLLRVSKQDGLTPVRWEETEHVQVTRGFLNDPGRWLNHLLEAVAEQVKQADAHEAADPRRPRGTKRAPAKGKKKKMPDVMIFDREASAEDDAEGAPEAPPTTSDETR